MMKSPLSMAFGAAAGLIAGAQVAENMNIPRVHYHLECIGEDGKVKWTEDIDNLVTNAGRADVLSRYFKLSALPAAWSIGLIDNASFSAVANADTLASHAGWLESTAYTGNRKAWTGGSITGTTTGSVDNVASPGAFAINATATINGCFLCDATSGTSGVLYSAASFSGGNRAVVNGDTLNVTATLTTT